MRPDERDLLPLPLDTDAALDAELAAIDDELAAAGRSITSDNLAPDPSFADALRARLLAELAAPAATPGAKLAAQDATPVDGPVPVGAPVPPPAPIRLADHRRSPARFDVRRWSVLAVAAVLVIAVVGVGFASRAVPTPGAAALAAVNATLTRGGATAALAAGTSLAAGDTITTGEGGAATVTVGAGFVRLDAGTSLRIDALGAGEIDLTQLTGRAWHRVDVPSGSRYVVATGDLRWTALGTAFDLRRGLPRSPSAVQLVAVVHDVALAGAGDARTIRAGEVATIDPAAGEGAAVAPAGPDQHADRWLADNAAADRADGLDTGWLDGATGSASAAAPAPSGQAAVPSPSAEPGASESAAPAEPSPAPSAAPSASAPASPTPSPSPRPTERPTPTPTARPEPTPTPVPTPKPTATPPPVLPMTLTVTSCDGGVLLSWSQYNGAGFHQYATLRSGAGFDMPATYPPSGDIASVASSVTTSIGLTSTVDRSLAVGATATYRAGAWNAKGQLIGDSTGHSATRKAVAGIDGVTILPGGASTHVSWSQYAGDCFSTYRVSWSATSADVSYLGAHDGSADNGNQAGADVNAAIPAGTWYVRVEVIKTTELESFVVAHSAVQQITVTP